MLAQEAQLSEVSRAWILQALENGKRADGRDLTEFRNVDLTFGEEYGTCTVRLGQTRVFVSVSAEVVSPRPDRPADGMLLIVADLNSMSSPAFTGDRQSELGTQISRILDKVIRRSNALDTESLCLVSGRAVWEIRVDVHVEDFHGSLVDCCCVAVLAALLHFRRPEAIIRDGRVTVYDPREKVPVPLTITHRPLAVTFQTYHDGKTIVTDATREEQLASDGELAVAMNTAGEICYFSMVEGPPVDGLEMIRCTTIANKRIRAVNELIAKTLTADNERRAKKMSGVEDSAENER